MSFCVTDNPKMIKAAAKTDPQYRINREFLGRIKSLAGALPCNPSETQVVNEIIKAGLQILERDVAAKKTAA